jgi:pre-mRNA-processing factor 17
MSALIAGYDSSDDESAARPSASTSTLPALGNGVNPTADDDDDEDDEKLDEQARADAFGLSAAEQRVEQRKAATTQVTAAPDVLKEVGVM